MATGVPAILQIENTPHVASLPKKIWLLFLVYGLCPVLIFQRASVPPRAQVHFFAFRALDDTGSINFMRISARQGLHMNCFHQGAAAASLEWLYKRQVSRKLFIFREGSSFEHGSTLLIFWSLQN